MIKLFITLALMLVSQAYAGDLFVPNADNILIKILGRIFGSDLFAGGGVSPLSAPMQTFNEGVLMLAGVYACYTLLTGILGTAHEGDVMGKKSSSVWIVIRYAIGTALILPVVGGYCTAQVLVAWLATQGNGLADSMWKQYTSTDNAAVIAVAGEEFPGIKDFVWNTYQTYGCLHALKGEIKQVDDIAFSGADKNSILGVTTVATADAETAYVGDKTEKYFPKDVCGTIRMPLMKVPTITTSPTVDQALVIDFDSAPALNAKVQEAQKAAFTTLIAQIDTLASDTIANNKAIEPAKLDALIVKYQETMAQLSSSLVSSINGLSTLSKNAQKGGWITSYTYFMQYAYLHDQISTALHNLPTSDGPKNAGHESLSGNFSGAIKPILQTVSDGGYVPSFGGYNQDGKSSEKTGDSGSFIDTIKGYWNKLKPSEIMKQVFLDKMESFKAKDGEFPIYTLIRLGDTMLGSATAALTAAGIALATIGAHPGIAALLQVLITVVLVPIIATGFLLKWFLPFLPFIIGVGVLGGMILGTAVSILVAPIWILGHLNPHADDLVGSSGNGYRVMLAMTLRPALTTFGVMISFSAILEIGKYISSAMAIGLALSQSGSGFFTQVVNYIAGPAIYAILMYKTIMQTLPYSHKIADEVLTVIGGGGFSPGSYADAVSHQDNHGAAGNAAASFAGGAAGALGARKLPGQEGGGNGGGEVGGGKGKGGIKNALDGKGGANAKFGDDKEGKGGKGGAGDGKMGFSAEQLQKSDLAKVVSGQAPVMMSEKQTALDSKLNSMKSFLSEGSQTKMDESIADSIQKNESMTDEAHLNESFKTALNNEYGVGAGALIKSAGAEGFDSKEAKELAGVYKQAKAEIKAASPYSSEKEILQTLSKATAQARQGFEAHRNSDMHKEDGKKLSDFVKQSFGNNLNLQANKDIEFKKD